MAIRKKLFSIILICILFTTLSFNVAAAENSNNIVSTDYEYLSDGSFYKTIIYEENILSRATHTSSKITTFYNADKEAMWYVKVTGTFSYNGSTSKCTSATANAGSYVNTWRIASKSASHSGSTAMATATAERLFVGVTVETLTKSVSLSCDKNGNLS